MKITVFPHEENAEFQKNFKHAKLSGTREKSEKNKSDEKRMKKNYVQENLTVLNSTI